MDARVVFRYLKLTKLVIPVMHLLFPSVAEWEEDVGYFLRDI